MPRPPRIDEPYLTYHVISRGVRRLPIFHDDEDRQRFLRFLSQIRHQYPFRLHSYCLMNNHFHLLLQTLECSLSKTMQCFKQLYAGWFNRKYNHVGHVFQSRFHSIPVETDAYFTTVSRYIHLNPVRAGIVKLPEDYAWSNYSRIIRGQVDPLTDPTFLLDYFRPSEMPKERYKRFVEDMIPKAEPITEEALWRMRFWGRPPQLGAKKAMAPQMA